MISALVRSEAHLGNPICCVGGEAYDLATFLGIEPLALYFLEALTGVGDSKHG